jgi:hypothetical protein
MDSKGDDKGMGDSEFDHKALELRARRFFETALTGNNGGMAAHLPGNNQVTGQCSVRFTWQGSDYVVSGLAQRGSILTVEPFTGD